MPSPTSAATTAPVRTSTRRSRAPLGSHWISATLGERGEGRLDHAESVAKAVVEALENGTRMLHQARQSHGEHDFDLVYGDGRIATLEVTAATDERAEATHAALRDERKGGHFIHTQLCRLDWHINPRRDARVNKIRERADRYLAEIEAAGLTTFFSPMDASEHESVRRIWTDLGVFSGSVMKWNPPGRIGISPPGGGGAISAASLTEAVLGEARKSDNLRKLGNAKTDERHLFVYVHPLNFLPWVALVDLEPPVEPLVLPEEITHVWAATEGRTSNEYVVWRAMQRRRWIAEGPLSLAV